jgi:hypothetical protein
VEASAPEQSKPVSKNGDPSSDLRGTKNAPIAVEILRTSDDENEANEVRKDREQSAATERWLTIFTGALTLATLGLFAATVLLYLSGEKSAEAAKSAANTAREALTKSQRAFVRVGDFQWVWRPDTARPGKYFYDISPIIENSGDTPTVEATVIVNSMLADTPLPDDFAFPYRSTPGKTFIGARQTIRAMNAIILDDDLLAVQSSDKFFYLWGTITYRDVFDGTPMHVLEYASQISRVMGTPLDPTGDISKGAGVEIYFLIYKAHNNQT